MAEDEHDAAVNSLLAGFGGWAIGDDYDLGLAIETANPDSLRQLVEAVGALPDSVWAWLAGSESAAPHPSDAYVAVSEITLAADYARVVLQHMPTGD
ncbi:hypothetical protein GCM10009844_38890 [Nocardioides koreensis]|uniref:Uncharacterized protein n=1 Tax=Nocardioides koreensis TaxID=433651 RepID=A0ABP5LXB3_9ACTN